MDVTLCDHHDLPLVCGECGQPSAAAMPGKHADWHFDGHRFRPVHVLTDPEGMEGDQRIPCTEVPA